MTVFPNVKLNLGLRVLGKRPDGFHELESLFIPYDGFRDELTIVPAPEFSIEIDGPCYRGWDPSEDLTARAWRLMRDEFGIDPVRICLTKNSPVGAGLGGGSSDGAFALRALNDIFSLGLSDSTLADLAARLGSDCPFFIYNRPMFVTGRGDVLEPFDIDLSPFRIEVAVPAGVSVSTKEAYAGLDAPTVIPNAVKESIKASLSLPPEQWRGRLVNDFERSVFPAHPEIAALKEEFYRRGAIYASMSGSGSAVFALFPANS
ncbi:MAG: 4-(cytidine 5'-diphospho)-2-C-methyl-D-erythritol kinase [Bacteroidales bacterium]|nr:4-(cytidine 5'-diphospho)-2-C-methyl-D-erythritol kinase [Bacteroidales bacterium]